MAEFLRLFAHTMLLRPYVFVFLLIYLVASAAHLGWRRTLLYIPAGYIIAWASEYSSIHWGIPYGRYCYITNTSELWVAGVPFMDSLSYVFLSYASFATALFILSPVRWINGTVYVLETHRHRRSWETLLLAGILMVLLDIIIDPLALRGDRWFLGRIYEYPVVGNYFGVPFSNFLGWFLTGLAMVKTIQLFDQVTILEPARPSRITGVKYMNMVGTLLYMGIIVFNLFITLWIKEYLLALVGCLMVSFPLILVLFLTAYKNRYPNPCALSEHLRDFPYSPAALIAQYR